MQFSIPNPCQQNWNEMDNAEQGKFCNSCNKTVRDLTRSTTREITDLLEKEPNTCIRIFKGQNINKMATVATLATIFSSQIQAQDSIIPIPPIENSISNPTTTFNTFSILRNYNMKILSTDTLVNDLSSIIIDIECDTFCISTSPNSEGFFAFTIPEIVQFDSINITFYTKFYSHKYRFSRNVGSIFHFTSYIGQYVFTINKDKVFLETISTYDPPIVMGIPQLNWDIRNLHGYETIQIGFFPPVNILNQLANTEDTVQTTKATPVVIPAKITKPEQQPENNYIFWIIGSVALLIVAFMFVYFNW
jgi:hypothetical protein